MDEQCIIHVSLQPKNMKCVTVLFVVFVLLGALCQVTSDQFLNNRPYPTYSLEHMPDTGFSCRDKVLGGYYADSETQCQMFHVCVKVAGLGVQDFRFLCPNGTAFDQDNQICAEWDDVDCEAATLYYSSDNFDLYRVGSGFETAAFPGEEEGTFHLQRSETGDARLNREHQSQRVNQQTNYNTAQPPKRPSPQPRERDLLRGSSSSNFFNNRNGGKDLDDDYTDDGAPNQTSDVRKKKIVRKFQNRKPVEEKKYEEPSTQKPSNRPTGFVNNFAGSYAPTSTTSKPTTLNEQYSTVNTNNNYRGKQGSRTRGGERTYNNADNFRNTNNNDGQNINRNQYTISTPAPFRQNVENRQYKNVNRQTTQYDNGQYNPTTAVPKSTYNYNQYENQRVRQQPTDVSNKQNFNAENYPTTPANNRQNNQYQSKQTDNYPSTVAVNKQPTNQYQTKQTDNFQSPAPVNRQQNQYQSKQPDTYQTSAPVNRQNVNTQYQQPKQTETVQPSAPRQNNNQFITKQTGNSQTVASVNRQNQYQTTTTAVVSRQNTNQYQSKQTENYPSTSTPFKQPDYNKQTTYKQEKEYQTAAGFTNKQTFNNQNEKRPTTQFKQTDNFPTTYSPNKQNYQKQTTQYYKETDNYQSKNTQSNTQFDQYNTKQTTQYNNQQSTQYNNNQYSQSNNYDNNNQYDRTQYQNTHQQTSQYSTTTVKPTTQHTQYTPTVPKQTTQYQYSTTTPSAVRFSKQFDETSYDDGSYNPKYDDEKYKPEDEFLKTAHSQNFASARNELISSTKGHTTQSPAPFSATTPVLRTTSRPNISKSTVQKQQIQPKSVPVEQKPKELPVQKKAEKDVSYDYAYYDSNIGSEPDYDIGTEFHKSTIKSN